MEEQSGDGKLSLPRDILPDCWEDESRMNSLFAPFRKKSVNPLDWNSKLNFWKTLIGKWCTHRSVPTFTPEALAKTFQRDGRTPLCLSTVIDEMLRSGDLVRLTEYTKNYEQSQTWSSWAVDLVVWRPLSWTLGKVKDSAITDDKSGEQFVHLQVIKDLGDYVMQTAGQKVGEHVVELEQLLLLCRPRMVSPSDLRLVLLYLQRQRHVTLRDDGTTTLVKFSTAQQWPPVITDADHGVFRLKRNEEKLQNQLDLLEAEKNKAHEEARGYVKKGMRQVAKTCLRKKKEIEKCIEKRATALENVQLLLHRISEAETDSKVLESYKFGVSALKQTFKEAGLTEDGVASTMNEVEEVLELHDDIQSSLSLPVGAEENLEDELAELMLSEAPEAPPTSPQAPPTSPRKGEKSELRESAGRGVQKLTVEDLPSPPKTLLATGVPKKVADM